MPFPFSPVFKGRKNSHADVDYMEIMEVFSMSNNIRNWSFFVTSLLYQGTVGLGVTVLSCRESKKLRNKPVDRTAKNGGRATNGRVRGHVCTQKAIDDFDALQYVQYVRTVVAAARLLLAASPLLSLSPPLSRRRAERVSVRPRACLEGGREPLMHLHSRGEAKQGMCSVQCTYKLKTRLIQKKRRLQQDKRSA
jgi:hypothetical protein